MSDGEAVVQPDLLEGVIRSCWGGGLRHGLVTLDEHEPHLARFVRISLDDMTQKAIRLDVRNFDHHIGPDIHQLIYVVVQALRRAYAELWHEFELGQELLDADPSLSSRLFVAPVRPDTKLKKGRN